MHTLSILADSANRPRRGRPQVEADPQERERHIACACRRLLRGESVGRVARRFDVSERTVHYWTNRALQYDHPVSRVLSELVAQRN